MIGTFDGLIIDCPDPRALGAFYAELLGMRSFDDDPDSVDVIGRGDARPMLSFRRVKDYSPPQWPGQVVPQQMHIDVKVDDLEAGEAAVLALGATATGSGSPVYRVYLDPAGHPFCLINPND
jgi:catechol 2,3-dioxygenase-like lactoylglutathione lyase family enzyme